MPACWRAVPTSNCHAMLRSTSKSLGNPCSQSWRRKRKAAVGRICRKGRKNVDKYHPQIHTHCVSLKFPRFSLRVFTLCFFCLTMNDLFAFSALTLLLGRHEEHQACKNWVTGCWCGYLSGVRCRLFAYGLADATASQNPIISCIIQSETGFYLSSKLAYP